VGKPTDDELLAALDFTPAKPLCAGGWNTWSGVRACSEVATHQAKCPGCDTWNLICDSHKKAMGKFERSGMRCGFCRQAFYASDFQTRPIGSVS
jgi:hypothetical protein